MKCKALCCIRKRLEPLRRDRLLRIETVCALTLGRYHLRAKGGSANRRLRTAPMTSVRPKPVSVWARRGHWLLGSRTCMAAKASSTLASHTDASLPKRGQPRNRATVYRRLAISTAW